MATEPNNSGNGNTDPNGGGNNGNNNEPVKVTFSDEQQGKIQQLIDAAVARTSANVRKEYDAKVAELTTQIESLKSAPPKPKDKPDPTDAQLAEFKQVVEQSKQEAERWRTAAQEKERLAEQARQEAQEIRKDVAITSAASKIPFFNLDVVRTLTKDQIQWDAERNTFVVKGPNGQIRYDATLENPLSLESFYTEFAANNKYLVRSELPSGSGSTESSRTNVSSNGRYEVTDIFGPKSSSAKASQLMKDNPQEYRRLKEIARKEGLIA